MGRVVQRVKFAQFSMSHTKIKEDYKKKCFVKISTLLLDACVIDLNSDFSLFYFF